MTSKQLIRCPECGQIQNGTIQHGEIFDTYIHNCECGYTIMESEWDSNVSVDSAPIKDLIHRDISRCNDDRCPTAPFCERYLQMAIDYKKGETLVSVTDFKGREKV